MINIKKYYKKTLKNCCLCGVINDGSKRNEKRMLHEAKQRNYIWLKNKKWQKRKKNLQKYQLKIKRAQHCK